MRGVYRDRREALLSAIAAAIPEAEVGGVSAGLHATVRFPRRLDEAGILEGARKRGIGLSFLRRHYLGVAPDESSLLLSYANIPESGLRTGLRAVASIISSLYATRKRDDRSTS